MHASTLICLALSFVGAFAQGSDSTDKGIIPTLLPTGSPNTPTSSATPTSSPTTTSQTTSAPATTTTSTTVHTTSTATSTSTKQEEQQHTTPTSSSSSSSSSPSSSSSSTQESISASTTETKTTDTSSTASSTSSSSASLSTGTSSTKTTGTSTSSSISSSIKSTSTVVNNANNNGGFVTNHASATDHDVAGPSSTWTGGASDDDNSNSNAPTGFLANKGAVAGTSIVAALAGIVGIWMLISFINRRRRRAAREAYRSDFRDMSTYEKKPEHDDSNDVEMAPAASAHAHGSTHGHPADASFGNDVDHVAVTAPADAYPDRGMHYGYEQSGAYAYNHQGQGGAYGQDYNAYGQGIVDLPPNQAGYAHAAYGAHPHPQQDPYGGYAPNPYGAAAGYNQGYPQQQQQYGAYGHAQ